MSALPTAAGVPAVAVVVAAAPSTRCLLVPVEPTRTPAPHGPGGVLVPHTVDGLPTSSPAFRPAAHHRRRESLHGPPPHPHHAPGGRGARHGGGSGRWPAGTAQPALPRKGARGPCSG